MIKLIAIYIPLIFLVSAGVKAYYADRKPYTISPIIVIGKILIITFLLGKVIEWCL